MSGGGGRGEWRPIPKPPTTRGSKEDQRGDSGREGAPPGAPPDPCNLVENTNLNSPNRAVLTGLRVGDVLSIEFRPGPPRQLVATTSSGDVAGSITSPSMPQIIQCI
jgi:hypothetical protein